MYSNGLSNGPLEGINNKILLVSAYLHIMKPQRNPDIQKKSLKLFSVKRKK